MSLYQRFTDLQTALREWHRGGRKGTAPRKVRANSNEIHKESQSARVKRTRKRDMITKSIQRSRRLKGQNTITGKKRGIRQ